MVIKNDNDNCTWGEDRTSSQKEGKYSLRGRQNKYQSYCYEFQKNGTCMKRDARFYILVLKVLRLSNSLVLIQVQTPRSRPSPTRKTNNLNRNTGSSNHNGHKPSQRYNNYNVCYKFQDTVHAHRTTDLNLGIFNNINTMLLTQTA